MRIPFANRMADVDLPAVPGQPKVTVKAVIDSFRDQVPKNFEVLFEVFVLLSLRKVRVTCKSSRALEDVSHLGLSFWDSSVTFHPCRWMVIQNTIPMMVLKMFEMKKGLFEKDCFKSC